MNESEPEAPAELVAATMSFWEAQQRTVLGLAQEIADPYISKDRLRQIAKLALMQCAALFGAQIEAEAQQAKAAKPESDLILPQSGIILP